MKGEKRGRHYLAGSKMGRPIMTRDSNTYS